MTSNYKCIHDGCNKRSSFNISGETRSIYCKTHKLENMISVDSKKRCEELNCKKYPAFNYSTIKRARYCNTHKKDGMINVVTKRCIHENCNKIPIYNVKGENRGIYCNIHKLENMINVKDNKCIEQGCEIRANYNIEGNKNPIYCNRHKKDGMVDICNRRCKFMGCKTRPTFNNINEKTPIYCQTHKLDNMINVVDNKCENIGCIITASYNYDHTMKPIYCSRHKLDNMIDIRSRVCLTPLCNIRVHYDKYNGYCMRCFVYLFPDKSVVKNYKTKERATVEYIKQEFQDITIILDKHISNGCSKRKPDLLIDLGYQVIICEVDENQHISYDCSCENKRIMELSQDVSHRPIVFIRFNPDQYIDNKNNTIKSCWTLNKYGICCVSRNKKREWKERLIALKSTIQYWMENRTDKMIETVQLFYDQNILV